MYSKHDISTVCIPTDCADAIFRLYHSHPTGGHFRPSKTITKLLRSVWWPGLSHDVHERCKTCLVCFQHNPPRSTNRALLQSAPYPSGPWTNIQIDFIGPSFTAAGGYKYCLVIIDKFTKWIEAFLTKNNTALTAARILLREVICRWGIPGILDSDQGSHFTGKVFTKLMELLEIDHKLHVSYHPQSSGVVERSNRTLKVWLSKFCADHPTQWMKGLPLCLMAIRSIPHATTGISPYQAMTGHLMRLPGCTVVMTEQALEQLEGNVKLQGTAEETWVKEMLKIIQETSRFVASNTGKAKQSMKQQFDTTVNHVEYEIGDEVMVRVYGKKESPFAPRWKGPFEILEKASPAVYLIATPLSSKLTKWYHVNQLKTVKKGKG
uniref:Gypsy retrotransposon integrase-like protein 1 n=1 Tax=Callorhinchus milii TaxID=7868 RepID=A0A4W3HQI2_CALMI